jgi:hypothetical protein
MGLLNERLARRECAVDHGLVACDLCLQLTMFLVQGLCLMKVLPQLVRCCKRQVLLDPLLLCIQFKHKLVKP